MIVKSWAGESENEAWVAKPLTLRPDPRNDIIVAASGQEKKHRKRKYATKPSVPTADCPRSDHKYNFGRVQLDKVLDKNQGTCFQKTLIR